MKNFMKKVWNFIKKIWSFIKSSNHYAHILGGLIVYLFGIILNVNPFGCLYATYVAAFSLELKDYLYNKTPDYVDFLCTIVIPTIVCVIQLLV